MPQLLRVAHAQPTMDANSLAIGLGWLHGYLQRAARDLQLPLPPFWNQQAPEQTVFGIAAEACRLQSAAQLYSYALRTFQLSALKTLYDAAKGMHGSKALSVIEAHGYGSDETEPSQKRSACPKPRIIARQEFLAKVKVALNFMNQFLQEVIADPRKPLPPFFESVSGRPMVKLAAEASSISGKTLRNYFTSEVARDRLPPELQQLVIEVNRLYKAAKEAQTVMQPR